MPDYPYGYSLVPVEHQPEFEDDSAAPMEHVSESPSIIPSNNTDMKTSTQVSALADGSNYSRDANPITLKDSVLNELSSVLKSNSPQLSGVGSNEQYDIAGLTRSERCRDECLHLLPSPSGDLQGMEYTLCFKQCMGRL